VNLRLVDRGWTIAFVPDAEVHHYFLANEVRNSTRLPRSLYQLAKSKAYFCWKHGPAQYSKARIAARLARHRAQLRRQLIWFQLTSRLSGADARRLRCELDEGLADGERSAKLGPAKAEAFASAPSASQADVGPTRKGGLPESAGYRRTAVLRAARRRTHFRSSSPNWAKRSPPYRRQSAPGPQFALTVHGDIAWE